MNTQSKSKQAMKQSLSDLQSYLKELQLTLGVDESVIEEITSIPPPKFEKPADEYDEHNNPYRELADLTIKTLRGFDLRTLAGRSEFLNTVARWIASLEDLYEIMLVRKGTIPGEYEAFEEAKKDILSEILFILMKSFSLKI